MLADFPFPNRLNFRMRPEKDRPCATICNMNLFGLPRPAGVPPEAFLAASAEMLRSTLVEHAIDEALIQQVVDSGYVKWQFSGPGSSQVRTGVMDTYYGNKYAGLFEMDEFVDYLRSGIHDALPVRFDEYTVKSLR